MAGAASQFSANARRIAPRQTGRGTKPETMVKTCSRGRFWSDFIFCVFCFFVFVRVFCVFRVSHFFPLFVSVVFPLLFFLFGGGMAQTWPMLVDFGPRRSEISPEQPRSRIFGALFKVLSLAPSGMEQFGEHVSRICPRRPPYRTKAFLQRI